MPCLSTCTSFSGHGTNRPTHSITNDFATPSSGCIAKSIALPDDPLYQATLKNDDNPRLVPVAEAEFT